MAYFDRQWIEQFELPDGTTASCRADVDRYLKANNLALAQDYSPEYIQKRRAANDKTRKDDLFSEFIFNYKRMIWNE